MPLAPWVALPTFVMNAAHVPLNSSFRLFWQGLPYIRDVEDVVYQCTTIRAWNNAVRMPKDVK